MRSLKILTWHVHGSYLYYLAASGHEFFLPVKKGRPPGYIGITPSYPWPKNLHEVEATDVRDLDLDCIIFQSRQNYQIDQHEILGDRHLVVPKIYLEHDPPRHHPTDTAHPVDDPNILIVHVTPFNDLMWNCRRSPTTVIEHGVVVPRDAHYSGELPRGIVVVNNIAKRGRRLGYDLFRKAAQQVHLDLVGMGWKEAGGIGEIPHMTLPFFESRYRFFFNPIRYTSMGLAVCEAMMIGMPIIAIATTEMVTVIENDKSGYLDTHLQNLVERMKQLLENPEEARRLGQGARNIAIDRFSIDRFVSDWNKTLSQVTGLTTRAMSTRRPFPVS